MQARAHVSQLWMLLGTGALATKGLSASSDGCFSNWLLQSGMSADNIERATGFCVRWIKCFLRHTCVVRQKQGMSVPVCDEIAGAQPWPVKDDCSFVNDAKLFGTALLDAWHWRIWS